MNHLSFGNRMYDRRNQEHHQLKSRKEDGNVVKLASGLTKSVRLTGDSAEEARYALAVDCWFLVSL